MTTKDYMYWDGIMADAIGATFFETGRSTKLDQCKNLASFLIKEEETRNLDSLNFDTSKTTYLLLVPDSSRNVRIIYGTGTSAGHMGLTTCDLECNIFALTGEYMQHSTVLTVVVFPPTVLSAKEMRIPDDKQMEEVLTTRVTKPFFFEHKNLTERRIIPGIVSIPAFLIYNGFNMDINALVIYEQIMSIFNELDDNIATALPLLITFLHNIIIDTTL
jgi:hypothetical protein